MVSTLWVTDCALLIMETRAVNSRKSALRFVRAAQGGGAACAPRESREVHYPQRALTHDGGPLELALCAGPHQRLLAHISEI